MKWNNEELCGMAEDALSDITSAIDTLSGVEEFKEIYEALKEIKSELKDVAEIYEEKYQEELEREQYYQNMEYERSVI